MTTPRPIKRLPRTMLRDVKLPAHAGPQPPAFQPVPSQIANASPEANVARVAAAGGRQNLYVAARDQEIWDWAERLAVPESLSSLVTRLLRRYVNQLQTAKDRIVVETQEYTEYPVRKAFTGRYLVRAFGSDQGTSSWHAAQGAKGGLAVWLELRQGEPAKLFRTYPDFEAFAADAPMPRDLVSAVSVAMGEEYAEEIEL